MGDAVVGALGDRFGLGNTTSAGHCPADGHRGRAGAASHPAISTGVRTAAITASRICSRIELPDTALHPGELCAHLRAVAHGPGATHLIDHAIDPTASRGASPTNTEAGYDIWWSVVEASPSNTESSGAVKPTAVRLRRRAIGRLPPAITQQASVQSGGS